MFDLVVRTSGSGRRTLNAELAANRLDIADLPSARGLFRILSRRSLISELQRLSLLHARQPSDLVELLDEAHAQRAVRADGLELLERLGVAVDCVLQFRAIAARPETNSCREPRCNTLVLSTFLSSKCLVG